MIKPINRLFGLASVILFMNQPLIAQNPDEAVETLNLRISFGNSGPQRLNKNIELKTAVAGMTIKNLIGGSLEQNDQTKRNTVLNYGAGDVDELIATVGWKKPTAALLKYSERDMWPYLMQKGSPGQVERLKNDPWNIPDAPILTVLLDKNGTEGFSFSLEQLTDVGAIWLPEQDVFLTDADMPVDFKQHIESLKGIRTLESVKNEPEASLEKFKSLWKDFGNPIVYDVPWQTEYLGTTGHLTITAASHGSIYKFAVDRWGNVRPDFSSPHRLGINITWEGSQWKSQEIENGLPIISTNLGKNGQTLELEQFAAPLGNVEAAIRGYVPSIFFTKAKFSGAGPIDYDVALTNLTNDQKFELKKSDDLWIVNDKKNGDIVLVIEAESNLNIAMKTDSLKQNGNRFVLSVSGNLNGRQSSEMSIKFPSPTVASSQSSYLQKSNFSSAKEQIVNYWNDLINKGAHFEVPEKEVNELFRANLWHALVLPRHTIGGKGENHMDLPYANTAYGQQNSDWPINQGVYVDYMIYGLRGYDDIAQNEIISMFNTQQQEDGRIGGYANWGVYSPAHLYVIAQNYLLSGEREKFEEVLPKSLKTLDWCLLQIEEASLKNDGSKLILGPLNDLTTGEKAWAFTQAYYVAGLELFGKALTIYGHERAEEVLQISTKMKEDVVEQFSRSSVKSPIVQLADGTWINYVPTEALTPRRMLDEWYPTDVDTGPLHLSRLAIFEPYSWLTTAMLNDHEDNLFLGNKGAANEPIYVQQANVYLLRDEPKAVIRSFYSLMACGFSHNQYTPLEHRWAHGQYYGPPSTDGAWFELYRKMLLNEIGSDTLLIGQAVPRKWLENGKKIIVNNAPTYFGDVSFIMKGKSEKNELEVTMEGTFRNPPKELWIRLRHPDEKPIRSVTVNGQKWKNFDVNKETIKIPGPDRSKYVISASY